MITEYPPIAVSARRFALAWRNVQLAAGDDTDAPQLCGTTLLEVHRHGVMLVSTDRYSLLWSWVGEDDDAQQFGVPDLDEGPDWSVLAADNSGLPKALMAYLAKQTKGQGGAEPDRKSTIDLAVGVFDEKPNQPTLGGVLDRPGLIMSAWNETVVAPIVELEFPDWRALARSQPVKSASRVGFGGHRLAQLGQVRNDGPGEVWMRFLGQRGGVAVEIPGDPPVWGRVMPIVPPAEERAPAEPAAGEVEQGVVDGDPGPQYGDPDE